MTFYLAPNKSFAKVFSLATVCIKTIHGFKDERIWIVFDFTDELKKPAGR